MATNEKSMMKGFIEIVKHPIVSIRSLGRGGSLYGLLIIFGFNEEGPSVQSIFVFVIVARVQV